ncbi:Trk system potassium transporter TrkA [Terrihabitans sp. B22-R8]|uniref:Trk system potassium transporter TrkA n=1 Tax=Terrihabitans sp. B22-R8 TaxID=3425128 RepID=UPI00403D0CBD
MKVVICGAGQVGFGIAERLAAEGNDVAVIDLQPRLIRQISDTLEVRGFVGHGAYPDVLAQAGIEHADMLIAVTQSDEVNMVACQVGHALFNVPTKIARIRSRNYLKPEWSDLFSRDQTPIDVVISPEIEVGEAILRRLAVPGAVDTISFANDTVTVAAILCDDECPVLNTPLKQLTELFPDLKARVIGIKRGERVFAPRSSDFIVSGDLCYVASDANQLKRTLVIFGRDVPPARRIIIAGGGNIGVYITRGVEKRTRNASITVIEPDFARATSIADDFHKAVVLSGNALDDALLRESGVGGADTFVAVTNDEKVNVLAAGLAKQLGCQSSICLVNTVAFSGLIADLGVDLQVNPRGVTVSRILRHVRRGRIRAVHSVHEGRAELIEAEALATSPLVGKPLRELADVDGVRLGAIFRNGQVIAPHGSTVIEAADRVVLFAEAKAVRRVEQLFRVSIEFF